MILEEVAWKESCFIGESLVTFLSITPDKLPLNQRIGMSLVSLGFCGMEMPVRKRLVGRAPVYKISLE